MTSGETYCHNGDARPGVLVYELIAEAPFFGGALLRGLDFTRFRAYNGIMNYNADATDQYIRSLLVEELSDDEADNAMTALSTLTSLFPSFFPFDRTFALLHSHWGFSGPSGVRFVVYGEEGEERSVHIPRADLSSVAEAIEAATLTASIWVL